MINEKNKYLSTSWLSGLLSAEIFISIGEGGWGGGVQMPTLAKEITQFLWSGSQGVFLVTPGFNGLGKDNCKMRRETFSFWDLVLAYIRGVTIVKSLWSRIFITLLPWWPCRVLRITWETWISRWLLHVMVSQRYRWVKYSAVSLQFYPKSTQKAPHIARDMGCPFVAPNSDIWVRAWSWGCLVTWFCYHLIAKPGNETASVSWPDPYILPQSVQWCVQYYSTLGLILQWRVTRDVLRTRPS